MIFRGRELQAWATVSRRGARGGGSRWQDSHGGTSWPAPRLPARTGWKRDPGSCTSESKKGAWGHFLEAKRMGTALEQPPSPAWPPPAPSTAPRAPGATSGHPAPSPPGTPVGLGSTGQARQDLPGCPRLKSHFHPFYTFIASRRGQLGSATLRLPSYGIPAQKPAPAFTHFHKTH